MVEVTYEVNSVVSMKRNNIIQQKINYSFFIYELNKMVFKNLLWTHYFQFGKGLIKISKKERC